MEKNENASSVLGEMSPSKAIVKGVSQSLCKPSN